MNWLEKHLQFINKRDGTDVSIYKFEKMCGFHKNHLKKNIQNNAPIENYSLPTLYLIAKASNMTLWELIEPYIPTYMKTKKEG